MKAYIILIPGILAVLISCIQSPQRAFLNVYMPCLFLLPILYNLKLSGLPDMGFAQVSLIPIFGLHLVFTRFKHCLPTHILDYLVILYVVLMTISEYKSTGEYQTSEGGILWITLLANKLTTVLFPYLLARWFLIPKKLSVPMAKRMVGLLIITLIISAWEWRFVVNAQTSIIGWFFPDQEYWIPTYRYGLVRISGPFPHPILLGIALGVTFLLNHWLVRNKLWPRNFSFFPRLPLSKGAIYSCILLTGLLLTISRAPIMGTFIGFLFFGAAYSTRRVRSLAIRFAGLGILLILATQSFFYYANIDRYLAESPLAGAAAYRVDILYKYLPYVQEKPYWGWGYSSLPESAGLRSIDNEFLWITLKHGLYTLACFLLIFIVTGIKLIRRGVNKKCEDLLERTFCMTMLGIFFMLGASLITVYMGGQIQPLFFILVGWAQGFLATEPGREAVRFLRPDNLTKSPDFSYKTSQ